MQTHQRRIAKSDAPRDRVTNSGPLHCLKNNGLSHCWVGYIVTASKNIEVSLLRKRPEMTFYFQAKSPSEIFQNDKVILGSGLINAQLHLFLVDLQHSQHNLVNENVDLLVGADQVNADLLAHRL